MKFWCVGCCLGVPCGCWCVCVCGHIVCSLGCVPSLLLLGSGSSVSRVPRGRVSLRTWTWSKLAASSSSASGCGWWIEVWRDGGRVGGWPRVCFCFVAAPGCQHLVGIHMFVNGNVEGAEV